MKTHEVIICVITGAITVMIAHSIGSGAALLAALCFVLAVVCIVAMYWRDEPPAPAPVPRAPATQRLPVTPTIRLDISEPATWQTERLED